MATHSMKRIISIIMLCAAMVHGQGMTPVMREAGQNWQAWRPAAGGGAWQYPSSIVSLYECDYNWQDIIGGNNGSGVNVSFTLTNKYGSTSGVFGSGYVSCPNHAVVTGGLFSVSMWVMANSAIDSSECPYAIGLGSPYAGIRLGGYYQHQPGNNIAYSIGLFKSDDTACSTGSNTFTAANDAGIWRHIVVTYNKNAGTPCHIYKDAILQIMNNQISGDVAPDMQITLGERSDHYFPFGGFIDEVAIFSNELSQAQVTDIFTNRPATVPYSIPTYYATVTTNAGYTFYSYTNTDQAGEFTPPGGSAVCDVLFFGMGGGEGSVHGGGGGGAGGCSTASNLTITAPVRIRIGLALDNYATYFGNYYAPKGGNGGAYNNIAATVGGSGGGGGVQQTNGAAASIVLTPFTEFGNKGGNVATATDYPGAGGGGAGGPGTNYTLTTTGMGGPGLYFADFTNVCGSPAGWVCAGGGGSGIYPAGAAGQGGQGGGGNGDANSGATSGTNGTGSGAGASRNGTSTYGGTGGCFIRVH